MEEKFDFGYLIKKMTALVLALVLVITISGETLYARAAENEESDGEYVSEEASQISSAAVLEEDESTNETADPGYSIDGDTGINEDILTAADMKVDSYNLPPVVLDSSVTILASGSCGTKATWSLTEDGVLTIGGSGKMTDYDIYTDAPWYSYNISSIVISSGITRVGESSFAYSTASSVSLPSSLLTIGEAAFYGCTNLTSITIPDSVTAIGIGAFANSYNITKITLGSSLETIKSYAFQYTAITTLTLPASLTTFGTEACFGCFNLTAYKVKSGNSSFAASDGVLFNKKKTELVRYPLGKTSTSYSTPSTVKTIDDYAFYMCTYLKKVTLSSKITKIGDFAFALCTAMTSVTIPDSVTKLGTQFCAEDYALTKAKIGKGVTELPVDTFAYCSALSSVTLGSGLQTIDAYAFCDCTGLKKLTIPDSVTYIYPYAFDGCTNLTLSLPTSLVLQDDGSYKISTVVQLTGTCDYSKAYEVLKLVNKERKAEGLSSLKMDKDLLEAAMQRAAETCLYFSHTRPSGSTCFTVSSKAYGENIALGQMSASSVMTSWMNSSGHKANILGSSYKSIGIGCFTQGGVLYWVQIFGVSSATTLTQPKNASKTFTVVLDASLFKGMLYVYAPSSSLKTGKSTTLQAYMSNPEASGFGLVKLKASSLVWSSGDKSVATVSSSGKVTAKGPGSTKIKGKTNYGSISASVKISASLSTPSISKISNTTSGIKITWKKVTGAKGYYIYRATSKSGKYTKIDKVSSSKTSYTNKRSGSYKISANKTYYYKIVAYNGSYKSSKSSAKSIKYIKAKLSSAVKTTSGIKLKWGKVSGAAGYYVYRKEGSGSYSKIATITKASTTAYRDKTPANGKTYTYCVKPYYKSGSSKIAGAYANSKEVTYVKATKITSLTNSSSKTLAVKWTKKSVSGYQIQYSTDKNFKNSSTEKITVSGGSTVSTKLAKLKKGKTYYVRIRTYKKIDGKKVYSAYSSAESIKIKK